MGSQPSLTSLGRRHSRFLVTTPQEEGIWSKGNNNINLNLFWISGPNTGFLPLVIKLE